jgi:hypothetical protein
MKKLSGKVLLALAAGTTSAYATTGAEASAPGFFTIAFLSFLAAIIVIQFSPGLILVLGLLRGNFTATHKKVSVATGNSDHIG